MKKNGGTQNCEWILLFIFWTKVNVYVCLSTFAKVMVKGAEGVFVRWGFEVVQSSADLHDVAVAKSETRTKSNQKEFVTSDSSLDEDVKLKLT